MSLFKYGEEKSERSCGSVGDVIKIAALKEINGPRLCISRPIADADTRQGPNIMGVAEDYFRPQCGFGRFVAYQKSFDATSIRDFFLALRCLFKLLCQKIRLLGNDSLSPGFFSHEQITTFTSKLWFPI